MSTAIVKPGVCGLESKIIVNSDDGSTVDIIIESACPHVKKMEDELQDLSGMGECFSKFSTSKVYETADKYCRHLACPVPTGIVKAIEVACGLALPRDVEIKISKE